MGKKYYFLIVCLFFGHLMGKENCQLLQFQGDVRIRKAYENQYQAPLAGMQLEDKMVLNATPESRASIKTYDGSIFNLPPNTQIEVDELKKRDRNELLMLLTGLELQQLPDKNALDAKQTAFVLHGSAPEPSEMTSEQVNDYIKKEINGAKTLYMQGYLSGFILKTTRLQMHFPDMKNEEINQLLIHAFDEMNMPYRKQKLIEKMKNQ